VADVRINQVSSEVAVTDAAAFLSPETLERIVIAVIARLETKDRDDSDLERDRTMGAS
jgi:hypothetical protein